MEEDEAVSADSLTPAYNGIVRSIEDALILVEACIRGDISHVERLPSPEESAQVIQSGNIFIFAHCAPGGTRRWLDGGIWKYTTHYERWRLYRQIIKPSPAGQKQNAQLKPSPIRTEAKETFQDGTDEDILAESIRELFPMIPNAGMEEDILAESNGELLPTVPNAGMGEDIVTESNSELLPTVSNAGIDGSLMKPKADLEKSVAGPTMGDGVIVEDRLNRETINFNSGIMTYRLIAYYTLADARKKEKLQIPSEDPRISGFEIRRELFEQFFEIPDADNHEEFKINGIDIESYPPRYQFIGMGGVGTPRSRTPRSNLPRPRRQARSSQLPVPKPNGRRVKTYNLRQIIPRQHPST